MKNFKKSEMERYRFVLIAQLFNSTGIEPDENEKKQCKRPKRRSTVAKKGQRYPNNRGQTYRHTNIYSEMKKQDSGYTISINPAKSGPISFSQINQAHQQSDKQSDYSGRS